MGFEAAVVSRHHRDVALFQQRRGEGDGVGDLCAAGGFAEIGADVGEAVEGALGADAVDFRESGEALPHVAAAFFELLAHRFDGFGAARVGECEGGGGLGEAGDVAGHLALKFVYRVDGGFGATDVTDSPAGHGEAFAVAVESERLLDELGVEGGEADEFQVAVDELFVDLIGKDDEVGVLDDDVGERFELGGGIGVAAGVARAVEDQHL